MIVRKFSRVTVKQLLLVTIAFCIASVVLWTWRWPSHGANRVLEIILPGPNPVIVWWTSGFPDTSLTRYCPDNLKCDIYTNRKPGQSIEAYLFYGSNLHFDDLPLPRKSKDIWGLYHEESPRNVEELMHEDVLRLFNYSATMSRFSNVPFPLQYLGMIQDITSVEYFVPTAIKNTYADLAPVLYLQSDCETSSERDAYVKALMKFIKIDSYGACLKNKEMPSKFVDDYLNILDDDEFLKFVARYKFVIAIENGVCYDYVTEKYWRAIKVGSVPIYFGSPSIRDWLPSNKSAILLEDYPTPIALSEHIKTLLANDSLYEEYLDHKIKQVIENTKLQEELGSRPYQTDVLQAVEQFECYVCKKVHERNDKSDISMVNSTHYNCPKPVSALTLKVNPKNDWVYSWNTAKKKAAEIYQRVTSGTV